MSAASAAASATTGGTPPVGGLDGRPSNTTCLAGDPPSSTVSLAVQRAFASLPNFTQPIAMLQEPGNSARWYVVQKTGSVRVFDNTPNVSTTREFINLSTRLNSDPTSSNDERGLLGMAFHPNFPTDPRVYFYYTATEPGLGLVDRVSQFRSTNGGTSLDLASEIVLFNVDDPEDNHNGGNIAFGPDGFLYIGIGDGGGADDAHGTIGNGQLLTTLLGKMLRIDVSATSATTTYTIPPSNPYATNARCNVNGNGTANCPEIFAYGFRNPVALELRSRQRRAVAQRCRPEHARRSGSGHARRQLRLALLRRHQYFQRNLRHQCRERDPAGGAVRPRSGLFDDRRLRVSRQLDSGAARALRVR